MSSQTDVKGRGSMAIHVRKLLIEKFGGEKKVNLAEISRDTGLHANTVRGFWHGTTKRMDEETMITWCWYLGVSESEIWTYKPPRLKATAPAAGDEDAA